MDSIIYFYLINNMDKMPTIVIARDNKQVKLTENDCVLNFDKENERIFKDIAPQMDAYLLDEYIDEATKIEEIKRLFCDMDFSNILIFYDLCKDCDTIYILDRGLFKAWALGLGLYLYPRLNKRLSKEKLRELFYDYVVSQPSLKPAAFGIFTVIDYGLYLNGMLLDIIDEYIATGKLVKLGAVYKAEWF
jgi:hypothetical protein